jgi:hypothetical protein
MKKPVFVLLALLALIPFAQAMAQTPAAPATDAATLQFLATLAAPQAQAPADLTPAPTFLTGCGNGPACAAGQLCCNLCGADPGGDPNNCLRCVTPIKGRCPLVS